MPDSKISNLPSLGVPNSTDVLPIVNSGSTKKITVSNLLASSPASTQALCRMTLTDDTFRNTFYSFSGGGCNNSIEYVVAFNSKLETDNSVIQANTEPYIQNMQFKALGKYLITARVGLFDMFHNTANNIYQSARLRLYKSGGSVGPFSGGTFNPSGQTLETTLSLNYAAGAQSPYPYGNGQSVWTGSHILHVTSVIPTYLQLSLVGFGGQGNGGTASYLVATNANGTQCELTAQRISL